MKKVCSTCEKDDLKQAIKLAFLLFPVATFLGGLGIGLFFSLGVSLSGAVIAPSAGVAIAFVLAASYYFRKIDEI